jgi:hypothetical protein
MAFDAKGYRQAAMSAGVPTATIEKTIADRTGAKGWWTGGKKGLGGAFTAAGNFLNLPSFAIGGMLNQGQHAFGNKYAQGQQQGLGIGEGIKNKRAVMSELPETFGVDPNSTIGKVIGFGGELLTPDPISIIGDVGKASGLFAKAGDKAGDVGLFAKVKSKPSKVLKKAGGVKDDVARTFLEKSYKLNKTDINKIAEAIGVTDESQKAIKVIDYLESLGLTGSNRKSLEILNKRIADAQKPFDALVKTGGQVSRTPYINAIFEEAVRQEALNTPASLSLSRRLFNEALRQEKLGSKALTDTDLTKTISQLWSDVAESAISDPKAQNLAKSLAKSGSDAREILRPGSRAMGSDLRNLITAQKRVGGQANTGLGTQLFNAFKPSALGAGVGAGYGVYTGQNPLKTGLIGAAAGIASKNPAVLNFTGKTLQKGLPKITSPTLRKGLNVGKEVIKRTPVTAFRVATQPNLAPVQKTVPEKRVYQQEPYKPTITPTRPPVKSNMPTAESFYEEIRKKRGY